MLMQFRIDKREGEMLPPVGWGLAYYDAVSDRGIFYPIPLNWLIRWVRYLYFFWNRIRASPETYMLLTKDEVRILENRAYLRGKDSRTLYSNEDEINANVQ